MLRNRNKASQKKGRQEFHGRREVKFPGLVNDAAKLDVHRNALYLALSGKRTDKRSKEILAAYHKLKGTHNGNGKDGRA